MNTIKIEKAEVADLRHGFFGTDEIQFASDDAEAKLEALGIPKCRRHGARLWVGSAGKVPSSYGYNRNAEEALLIRNTKGWRVVEICRVKVGNYGHTAPELTLAPHQLAYLAKPIKLD